MKKIIKFSLISLVILIVVGCVNFFRLSDLRTDEYNFPTNQAKAQELIQAMGRAHNIQMWDSIETYNATFEDEFYGFMGKNSNPFKEDEMKFSLNYIPKTFNGQMEILNGKDKGKVWGIQDFKTYRKVGSGAITMEQSKEMKFWLPTYQYFIEFPSRIQEATIIDYFGEKELDGVKAEGIIASWNSVAPQKDIDQYIIWINAKSKRIIKVEYTVREAFRFITGVAHFQKYKNYDGFLLPSELPVESNLVKDGFLHKMSISSFTPNPLPAKELMPLD